MRKGRLNKYAEAVSAVGMKCGIAAPLARGELRQQLRADEEARYPHLFYVYGGKRAAEYAILPTPASLEKQKALYIAQQEKVEGLNKRRTRKRVIDGMTDLDLDDFVPYGTVATIADTLTCGERAKFDKYVEEAV